MISTDNETRQLLAREHQERLARDMRLARRTRPDEDAAPAARRALSRVHHQIRALTRFKPSHAHLAPEA
jgi:hypothetical protein